MDKNRSIDARDYQDLPPVITAMAKEYPRGHVVKPHSHRRGQLLYAIHGIMRVQTRTHAWTVPPQRAVWLAPGLEHWLESIDDISIRTLYISPERDPFGPGQSHVLAITPLIRELILRILDAPIVYEKSDPAHLCAELLLQELPRMARVPVQLPLPESKRLKKVCDTLLARPDHAGGAEHFADMAAVSARTLERMFLRELGMTFGKWREQARLREAIARLSRGEPVQRVANRLGYANPSAFSAMFKRHFGVSPTQINIAG